MMKNQHQKLPKGKRPISNFTMFRDISKAYCKSIGVSQKHPKRNLYNEVMKALFDEIFDEMVYNCFNWKLPMRLGFLHLRKMKPISKNKRPIDWYNTNLVNKQRASEGLPKIKIYHDNYDTDGDIYSIKWFKDGNKAIFINKKYYRFDLVRTRSRSLVAPVREGSVCNKN